MLEPNNVSRLNRRRRLSRRELPEPPAPRSSSAAKAELHPANPAEGRLRRVRPDAYAERLTQRRRVVKETAAPRSGLRRLFSGKTTFATTIPIKPTSEREMLQRNSNSSLRPITNRVKPAPRVQPNESRPARPESLRLREPSRSERLRPMRRNGSQAEQPATLATPSLRKRRVQRQPSMLIHVTRLIILGIGVGAIAGTLLAILDPAARQGETAQATRSVLVSQQTSSTPNASPDRAMGIRPVALQLGEPMTQLTSSIQALTAQYDGLTPGVFLMDMDTGAYVDLNGTSIFSTASMVKVPILVAFLQDVDAGKIRLDEMLTMKPEDVAEGSGEMQYEPPGTQFTALETASEMITISDNTATNMLITRLGGAEALNERFRQWGLTNTVIRNPLPDLEGTNTTTPKELSDLTARVSQGDLLSLRSRDRFFDIMRHTVTNTLIPAGVAPEATVAHKTGDIGSLVGDVGMVDSPDGKRYVLTVMVQRPHNDDRAQELIRQISRTTYEYINNPPSAENGTQAEVSEER